MSSIHISKRDGMPFAKALMIRLIGVLLSLVVCAVVIVALTKLNPVEVYKAIFSGAVGTSRRAWVTIRDALILLCVAIGLTRCGSGTSVRRDRSSWAAASPRRS